jgi:hypothetical protein
VREQRRSDIFTEINARVTSERFWLRVEVDEDGDQMPPVTRLARDLQQWLDSLDADDVQRQFDEGGAFGVEGFTWTDERSGWQLTLFPTVKTTHSDGDRVLATMGGEARMIDDRGPVRKAIDGKARKYGASLDLSLVLALGVLRPFADDTDLMDAFYGDSVLWFEPDTGKTNWERKPNGVWIGPGGPRRRQLSAVVVCDRPEPSNTAKLAPSLWLNPWADVPLQCEPPQMSVWKLHEGGAVEKHEPHETLRHLLDLPAEWPGPEPPYPPRPRRPVDNPANLPEASQSADGAHPPGRRSLGTRICRACRRCIRALGMMRSQP